MLLDEASVLLFAKPDSHDEGLRMEDTADGTDEGLSGAITD